MKTVYLNPGDEVTDAESETEYVWTVTPEQYDALMGMGEAIRNMEDILYPARRVRRWFRRFLFWKKAEQGGTT